MWFIDEILNYKSFFLCASNLVLISLGLLHGHLALRLGQLIKSSRKCGYLKTCLMLITINFNERETVWACILNILATRDVSSENSLVKHINNKLLNL